LNNWAEKLEQAWLWLTTSKYTRNLERSIDLLESQVTELRRDNRALMNSLLGTVGVAPVDVPERLKEVPRLHRRSWQQLQRQRTMESARRPSASTVEADHQAEIKGEN
jgi:hypothetical protein